MANHKWLLTGTPINATGGRSKMAAARWAVCAPVVEGLAWNNGRQLQESRPAIDGRARKVVPRHPALFATLPPPQWRASAPPCSSWAWASSTCSSTTTRPSSHSEDKGGLLEACRQGEGAGLQG